MPSVHFRWLVLIAILATGAAVGCAARTKPATPPEQVTILPRLTMGGTDEIDCFALSPDGKTAAAGRADGTIDLWDLAGGKVVLHIVGSFSDRVGNIDYS